MTAKPRHVIHNTQELVTSTDFNRRQSMHHAALLALGIAMLRGDGAVDGVVSGGLVTATGSDLNVSVSALLALRTGTAASADDSTIQWIETTTATTIDLTSLVDGGNPRWVAIEVTDTQAAEAQEVVQIFNNVTKSFSGLLRDKVIAPAPTFSTRPGTAAATPIFPAGSSGVIPLAYVYLGAGAATINATDIVMCRPMLRSDSGGDQAAPQRDVYGGGFDVATAGLAISLHNAGGRFAGHRVRWGISAADGSTAYTLAAAGVDGAALPVADDILYLYACPAPYPAGYDSTLAPREHRPGATALTRYQGLAAADIYNAVVVASTVAPQVGSPIGAPTAGDFSIECAPFSATGVPVTIDRTEVAYLGAGFYDFGTGFLTLEYLGGGDTRWTQSATTSLPVESDVQNSGSTGPNTGDAWVALPLSASGAQIVPDVAVSTLVELSQASASASVIWSFGIIEDAGPTIASGSGSAGGSRRIFIWLRTRAFGWTHAESFGANSTLNFVARGWRDGVLAQR